MLQPIGGQTTQMGCGSRDLQIERVSNILPSFVLQFFSDGLAKLCNQRFEALLAEPRGNELLDPLLQTAGSCLVTPAAMQGTASLNTIDTNASAGGSDEFHIGCV